MFVGVALVLAALLAATLGVGEIRATSVGPSDVARARAETATYVRGEIAALVDGMRRQANAVAARPEVVAALTEAGVV